MRRVSLILAALLTLLPSGMRGERRELRGEMGLFLAPMGVVGYGVGEEGSGALTIRGVGGNRALFMVDGVPQKMALNSHSIIDLLYLGQFDSLELFRGPASLKFGSGAMGGALNLVTKGEGERGRYSRARVSYGLYNSPSIGLSNSYSGANFYSHVTLTHEGTEGHRRRGSYAVDGALAKVGYRVNSSLELSSTLLLSRVESHNPGEEQLPLIDNRGELLWLSGALSLIKNHRYGRGSVTTFINGGDYAFNEGYSIYNTPPKWLFNSREKSFGIKFIDQLSFWSGNSISIGIDYSSWRVRAYNSALNSTSSNSSNISLLSNGLYEISGYLHIRERVIENIELSAGVRFEYSSSFGEIWAPEISIAYLTGSGGAVRGSISKGYRAPSIAELYLYHYQNRFLQPENLTNYQLTMEQELLNSKLRAQLRLFYSDLWNLVEVTTIDGMPKNLNVGYCENSGVELELNYKISSLLKTTVSYALFNSSTYLLRAPKHHFYGELEYSRERVVARAELRYLNGLYINLASREKENFALFNLSLGYRATLFGKKGLLFLRGDNLTASLYSLNEGFPMPKVMIKGGIDINF